MDANRSKPAPGLKQALRAAELILRLAQRKAQAADASAKSFRRKLKVAKKAARRAKKAARQARKQLAVARQACADIKARIPAPVRRSPPASKTIIRPASARPPVPARPRRKSGKKIGPSAKRTTAAGSAAPPAWPAVPAAAPNDTPPIS